MNKPFVVGLTGQTGSGKSEIARILGQKGCFIIDADKLARLAVEPKTMCLQQLTEAFSTDILHDDGTLNRKRLAHLAFSTPQKTELLNSIVHPEVIRMTEELLEEARKNGKKFVIIDAPLLFQAGLGSLCNCTICVVAPQEMRLQRICERDKITNEEALTRILAQPDDTYYIERATITIHNTQSSKQLHETVERLYEQLEEWRHER